MSAWARVLDDLAARGGTVPQVAVRLGLPEPLVAAIVDHAERLGLVRVGSGCESVCAPPGADAGPACAGCPLRGGTSSGRGRRSRDRPIGTMREAGRRP